MYNIYPCQQNSDFTDSTHAFAKVIPIVIRRKHYVSTQAKSVCTYKNKENTGKRKEIKTVIEVKHLVKKYGDHTAVNDLSFTLESGKIYGFLGPNGAGKSTTMNMMTGYIASTSGQILINGHDILTETEEAKKCIGYLPEIPPLYVDMTVWEYLITVADLKKVPKKERDAQLEKIMETVQITDMKKRLIKNLSKGYRQRVGIAQALIGYPEIIILDEPTVGLDPKQIIEIRDLVKSLGKDHTVILSSHILTEISAVCDYVLIINKGRLVAADATENLSKMFAGQNSLELLLDVSQKEAEKVLAKLSKIETVHFTRLADQTLRVELNVGGDTDIRRELFFAFADARIPILEMKNASVTLEDIFLEVTGGTEVEQKTTGVSEVNSSSKIIEVSSGNKSTDTVDSTGKEDVR